MSEPSFGDRMKQGLESLLAWQRGEVELRTYTLKMPDGPPKFSRREIRNLRREMRMSQAEFAKLMAVSTQTVQSWEQGLRKPGRCACRLLQFISLPEYFEERVAEPRKAGLRAIYEENSGEPESSG